MMIVMATKKRPATKSGKPRARRGIKIKPTDLGPKDLRVSVAPGPIATLAAEVEADGGAVLATYREPLGGHFLLLCALPIDKVEPTPYQRDVSDSHVRNLTRAMDKTKRYLDPVIAVRQDGRYLTPNGGHRLTALAELGARTILALLVPEHEVAYQILALNIEKAHNLREKALEVVRMYRELARLGTLTENDLQLEFEEPAYITLGFAYEEQRRLAGSVYLPVLRRVDSFLKQNLVASLAERERRARLILDLDAAVSEVVSRLKQLGLESPYLKNFVVARINPLRFLKGEPPSFDTVLANMIKRAHSFDTRKISGQDLARSGGVAEAAE